jgi:hypothetical protein
MSDSRLISLATVLIGVLNLAYAGRLVWRSWRARRWPTRDGEVLSANLEQRKFVPAYAAWGLRVLYRYTVGADTHTGAVISPERGPAFSEELGRHTITRYWTPGTAVKVYVNPRDPKDAMLAPRVSWPNYLLLVGGAALMAGGMWDLLS